MRLEAQKLEVWMVETRAVTERQWSIMLSWLDSEELARAQRFQITEDRHSYVLAHALRRAVLAKKLNVSKRQISFSSTKNGLPTLNGLKQGPLYFSHSHTRGLALCVTTQLGSVGIDVELARPMIADLNLLSGFVHLPHAGQRERELGSDPSKQFFFYWTLLEAYWKAAGTGLSLSHPPIKCRKGLEGTYEISLVSTGPQEHPALGISLKCPTGWTASLVVNTINNINAHELSLSKDWAISYHGLDDLSWGGEILSCVESSKNLAVI